MYCNRFNEILKYFLNSSHRLICYKGHLTRRLRVVWKVDSADLEAMARGRRGGYFEARRLPRTREFLIDGVWTFYAWFHIAGSVPSFARDNLNWSTRIVCSISTWLSDAVFGLLIISSNIKDIRHKIQSVSHILALCVKRWSIKRKLIYVNK